MQLATEQILRSRYHSDFPITAKDPLTNEVIVGEVAFFVLLQGEQQARYFGSDFNYASSKLFRDQFKEFTQDKPLIDLGYRPDNADAAQPNLQSVVPALPLHPTDTIAFSNFMTSLQRQATLGLDVA